MASTYAVAIPPISAKKLFQSLFEFAQGMKESNPTLGVTLNIRFAHNNSNTQITNYSESEQNKQIAELAEKSIILNATVSFPNFSLSYQKTPTNNNIKTPFSEIGITASGNHGLEDAVIAPAIKKVCDELTRGYEKPEDGELGTISNHSEVLSALEAHTIDIQKKSYDFYKQTEDEFVEKRKELNEETEELRKKLQAESDEKKKEYQTKLDSLDDRNNTHVRREIRAKINKDIQNRIANFKLSKDTSNLRWPIHILCSLFIVLSLIGVIAFSKDFINLIGQNEKQASFTVLVFMAVKPITMTLLGSGTFIYYVKWLNKWFEKNSQEEFFLRKYQLDIERSSWLVETVLEGLSQYQSKLPNELMMRFTQNLFVNENQNTKEMELNHPVEDFFSKVLDSNGKARLKVGENEVEVENGPKKK